jgi:hypothetical protein
VKRVNLAVRTQFVGFAGSKVFPALFNFKKQFTDARAVLVNDYTQRTSNKHPTDIEKDLGSHILTEFPYDKGPATTVTEDFPLKFTLYGPEISYNTPSQLSMIDYLTLSLLFAYKLIQHLSTVSSGILYISGDQEHAAPTSALFDTISNALTHPMLKKRKAY